jgi:CAAX prenyl protease-like protein
MTLARGTPAADDSARHGAAVYVLPFALYLGLTVAAGQFPDHYPWLYGVAVLITGVVTAGLLYRHPVLRPHPFVLAGVVVGLAGIAVWIPLSLLHWERLVADHLPSALRPQPRVGFDPAQIADPLGRGAFLAVRLFGLAVLVPVAEELFWRGFLLRWLIAPDWRNQELGRFTPQSFAVVTVLFAVTHAVNEWPAALIYCALLNALLYWKRDLWNCVVAHAVSNLVLGLFVLRTGTYELW